MLFQPMASLTRQLSRRSVFEGLLHRSPISRAFLAKVTGLSKQTMSAVIDAFEQQGLVHQVGRTSGNVGRIAVLYELSPEGNGQLARMLLQVAPRPVEIRTSTLGKRAGVVGALSVALHRLHDEFFGAAELATPLPLPSARAQ